jgi:dTMP kinase
MKLQQFWTFEGIDGSGKSTQAKILHQKLLEQGKKSILTSEPTNWHAGKLIRQMFVGNIEANDYTIAGLFVADRLNHINNCEDGILKLIADGNQVVCDRYVFSSYAYQAVHMDMDWVIQANALACRLASPQAHFFIDVPPQTCIQRIEARLANIERYETLENLEKVRKNYYKAFDKLAQSETIYVIDGDRNEDEIARDIWKIVAEADL